MEFYEVLIDDDIVSRATCGSKKTRNLENRAENDEKNLVIRIKLRHGDALAHMKHYVRRNTNHWKRPAW